MRGNLGETSSLSKGSKGKYNNSHFGGKLGWELPHSGGGSGRAAPAEEEDSADSADWLADCPAFGVVGLCEVNENTVR